jgi:hypothetical protein
MHGQRNPIDAMAAGNGTNSERFSRSNVSQKQYFEESQQMQQIPHRATAVVTEEVKKQIEDLVFRKGEEMDRSKHTITFMGQKYPMNTVVRVNNYNEQSKAILEASAIKEEDRVNIDGDNVILDLNEAAIVVRGQARHIETMLVRFFAASVLLVMSLYLKIL